MSDFKPEEFECNCGCGLGFNDMQPALLTMLYRARFVAGVPFILKSAIRCPRHNSHPDTDGSPTSSHLTGYAIDIKAIGSHSRFKILEGLFKAGFKRIGAYENFIHADCDPHKPNELCWNPS